MKFRINFQQFNSKYISTSFKKCLNNFLEFKKNNKHKFQENIKILKNLNVIEEAFQRFLSSVIKFKINVTNVGKI